MKRKTIAQLQSSVENPAPRLQLRKMYLAERAKGFPAKHAWNNVKTMYAWDLLDYGDIGPNQDRTLVRLRIVADDCCSLDDLLGDCFNPKVNPEIPAEKLEKQRQAEIDRINRDGVWGVIGEYRVSAKENWQQADSCFGFIGDDWKDSGYDIDIMQATLNALEKAQADVCPHCGRPRH